MTATDADDPLPPLPIEGDPWRLVERTTVYGNPWITVVHDEVVRPDGSAGVYGVVRFANRATAVVAVDDDDRVALVGQWRYPLGAYSWELPEGGAPAGEAPEVAAARELAEEAGVVADHLELLGRTHLSNSVTDEEAFSYYATGLRAVPLAPEATEVLRVQWLPFDEALARVDSGEITDVLTVVSLLLADRRRRRAAAPPA